MVPPNYALLYDRITDRGGKVEILSGSPVGKGATGRRPVVALRVNGHSEPVANDDIDAAARAQRMYFRC